LKKNALKERRNPNMKQLMMMKKNMKKMKENDR